MVGSRISPYLTTPEGAETAANRYRSYEGQAHFAGTGPPGMTCAACAYFVPGSKREGKAETKRCGLWPQLKGRSALGPRVPSNALACKYFEKRRVDEPTRSGL